MDKIPESSNGMINNPILTQNQDIINIQGVGAVIKFMEHGANTCDDNGENCRSLFGSDDSFDFTSASGMSHAFSGAEGMLFENLAESSASIASQVGSLALRCDDRSPHIIAGVAFKALACYVNSSGEAELTYQTCSAPMRGLAVIPPANAVACSSNPNSPNFNPPPGQTCLKRSCASEPEGSLDGWTKAKTIKWNPSQHPGVPTFEEPNNGMGITAYPDLGGTQLSLTSVAQGLTAVRIAKTHIDPPTGDQTIGLNIVYRHSIELTKSMLEEGSSAVPNPEAHSSQWEIIQKLAVNKDISKYEADFAESSTLCLQKLHEGLISASEVKVCNEGFSNESGLKAIATAAKISAADGSCGTVSQCVKEVTTTNSWEHTCQSEIPMLTRECITTTTHEQEDLGSYRTRTFDACSERRSTFTSTCTVSAAPENCKDTTPPATEENPDPTPSFSCSVTITSNTC